MLDGFLINIEEITADPLVFDGRLENHEVRNLLGDAAFEGAGGEPDEAFAELHVEISRNESEIHVSGCLRGQFTAQCGRCLGSAELRVEDPKLYVRYVPAEMLRRPNAPEVELESGELDLVEFSGTTLDLLQLVREQMLLALPILPLCREDCPGIAIAQSSESESTRGDTASPVGWKESLERLRDAAKH